MEHAQLIGQAMAAGARRASSREDSFMAALAGTRAQAEASPLQQAQHFAALGSSAVSLKPCRSPLGRFADSSLLSRTDGQGLRRWPSWASGRRPRGLASSSANRPCVYATPLCIAGPPTCIQDPFPFKTHVHIPGCRVPARFIKAPAHPIPFFRRSDLSRMYTTISATLSAM